MSAAVCAPDVRVAPAVVRPFRDGDAAQWEAFVERSDRATFFHRIGWRGIIADVFRHRTHYLVAERDARVAGILPLAEVRSRLFGHALTSLPFAVYAGAVADDAATEGALIDAAVALGRELRVDHLELRQRAGARPQWPRQDLYVTFRKPILPDVEANLLAIPRKQRAMVRKGAKNGLRSVIDTDAKRFFDLYADNVHRHGTPAFPRRYFTRLLEVFGDCAQVLVVEDAQGAPVSGVLSFLFRDEVLPYYAGDRACARELAANDFKYWELMRRACEGGVRVFDYGRSKRGSGSYDFKHNWGFEATPLAYEYQLYRRDSVPQNNPANPKYRALIALWRALPRAAVTAIGPSIARHLG
jgi:FemAB-related protein (PEP-CTERM system-associated)